MPWFHTHLHNAHIDAYDEEGQELPDLAAARETVLKSIRGFIGNEAMSGKIDLRGRVDIETPEGQVLESIAFSEAFELQGLQTL